MYYDELIRKLKSKAPEPPSPDQLTARIMDSITGLRREKGIHFSLQINSGHWPVIYAVRFALTAIAASLIIFLIVEQRGITEKLKMLEESAGDTRRPSHFNYSRQVKYLELSEAVNPSIPVDSVQNLQINRRTLNFLLTRIRELESENLSIRDKLAKYYVDSLTIHNSQP